MRTKTYDAITQVLDDGSWHAADDLKEATTWPAEWVEELEAEGLIDTKEQTGSVLVRLCNPGRVASA